MAYDHGVGAAPARHVTGARPGGAAGPVFLDAVRPLHSGGAVRLGRRRQREPECEPGVRPGGGQPNAGRDQGDHPGAKPVERNLRPRKQMPCKAAPNGRLQFIKSLLFEVRGFDFAGGVRGGGSPLVLDRMPAKKPAAAGVCAAQRQLFGPQCGQKSEATQ